MTDAATGSSVADWIDAVASVIETLAIIGGGLWALYLYRTGRRGEVTLGIEPRSSIIPDSSQPGRSLLLVHLKLANVSGVVFHHDYSTATLIDASQRGADGQVLMFPFAEQDPLLPVYGDLTGNLDAAARGDLFTYYPGQQISLEPGESVETELAFPLKTERPGLLAMRVSVEGYQRKRDGAPFKWSSFFFIPPLKPEGRADLLDDLLGFLRRRQ
jgi:hypothetical protein